jgi:hypothetical protein
MNLWPRSARALTTFATNSLTASWRQISQTSTETCIPDICWTTRSHQSPALPMSAIIVQWEQMACPVSCWIHNLQSTEECVWDLVQAVKSQVYRNMNMMSDKGMSKTSNQSITSYQCHPLNSEYLTINNSIYQWDQRMIYTHNHHRDMSVIVNVSLLIYRYC